MIRSMLSVPFALLRLPHTGQICEVYAGFTSNTLMPANTALYADFMVLVFHVAMFLVLLLSDRDSPRPKPIHPMPKGKGFLG